MEPRWFKGRGERALPTACPKQPHKTRADAERVAEIILRKKPDKFPTGLDPYLCHNCNQWHLSSEPRGAHHLSSQMSAYGFKSFALRDYSHRPPTERSSPQRRSRSPIAASQRMDIRKPVCPNSAKPEQPKKRYCLKCYLSIPSGLEQCQRCNRH